MPLPKEISDVLVRLNAGTEDAGMYIQELRDKNWTEYPEVQSAIDSYVRLNRHTSKALESGEASALEVLGSDVERGLQKKKDVAYYTAPAVLGGAGYALASGAAGISGLTGLARAGAGLLGEFAGSTGGYMLAGESPASALGNAAVDTGAGLTLSGVAGLAGRGGRLLGDGVSDIRRLAEGGSRRYDIGLTPGQLGEQPWRSAEAWMQNNPISVRVGGDFRSAAKAGEKSLAGKVSTALRGDELRYQIGDGVADTVKAGVGKAKEDYGRFIDANLDFSVPQPEVDSQVFDIVSDTIRRIKEGSWITKKAREVSKETGVGIYGGLDDHTVKILDAAERIAMHDISDLTYHAGLDSFRRTVGKEAKAASIAGKDNDARVLGELYDSLNEAVDSYVVDPGGFADIRRSYHEAKEAEKQLGVVIHGKDPQRGDKAFNLIFNDKRHFDALRKFAADTGSDIADRAIGQKLYDLFEQAQTLESFDKLLTGGKAGLPTDVAALLKQTPQYERAREAVALKELLKSVTTEGRTVKSDFLRVTVGMPAYISLGLVGPSLYRILVAARGITKSAREIAIIDNMLRGVKRQAAGRFGASLMTTDAGGAEPVQGVDPRNFDQFQQEPNIDRLTGRQVPEIRGGY